MIMFVGGRAGEEREAFRNDYRAVFGSMTRDREVDDPDRITEFVSRAFTAAAASPAGAAEGRAERARNGHSTAD